MTRNKVKLAWVANENSRTMSLKKRRLGLVKKLREFTILCDVKACLIIFSPKEAEPIVWPSAEASRDLLDDFFALPEVERKKKETTLESYLKEKTKKLHEQLVKTRKKNMEYVVNQLMVQLHHGRGVADFNLSEIYELLSFSKEKIMFYRGRLNFTQHSPLPDPPMHLFEAQSKELRTTTNDVFMMRGGQVNERARKTEEATTRLITGTVRENQNHYLMDQWFFPSAEPLNPQTHQTSGIEMVSYNANPNLRSYLPYQGSNGNGNLNLEIESVGLPAMMTFPGCVGSREFVVKEEGINNNNENSQFHSRSIATTQDDGLLEEPPSNETIAKEGNVDVTLFDINRVWPEVNNHRF